MKTMLRTAVQRPFKLLFVPIAIWLLPTISMAHVGDHHAMDFFHGLMHFIGEHYPFILGPVIITVCCWLFWKSTSSKK